MGNWGLFWLGGAGGAVANCRTWGLYGLQGPILQAEAFCYFVSPYGSLWPVIDSGFLPWQRLPLSGFELEWEREPS
ncbi:MAG: hypothetical protein EA369_01685 [Bradymonadales bacterium]|nr:MAG: hypothetical protein EA369_01685 [Bradymonadales bacterium]